MIPAPTNRHMLFCRGVQNPMKISDIGFLKTERNRPKTSKTKNSVSAVRFSKTDFGGLGTVFTLSQSQFILQHDRINSQRIFLNVMSLYL